MTTNGLSLAKSNQTSPNFKLIRGLPFYSVSHFVFSHFDSLNENTLKQKLLSFSLVYSWPQALFGEEFFNLQALSFSQITFPKVGFSLPLYLVLEFSWHMSRDSSLSMATRTYLCQKHIYGLNFIFVPLNIF